MEENAENKDQGQEVNMESKFIVKFTLKKLVTIISAVVLFISGTGYPFIKNRIKTTKENIAKEIKLDYEYKTKELQVNLDNCTKFKTNFEQTFTEVRYSLDFLKIHSSYNAAYVKLLEDPTLRNKNKFQKALAQYTLFIKNIKVHDTKENMESIYFSDKVVYIESIPYPIPLQVLENIE